MNVMIRKRTPTPTVNTRKDISNKADARAFWGGAAPLGGGVTPVHTTLIPELPFPASPFGSFASTLAGKPASRSSSILASLDNINPLMNAPAPPVEKPAPLRPFDGLNDPFHLTFKTMDPYRMQLWNNVARQRPMAQPLIMQQPLSNNTNLFARTSLAQAMQPLYLSEPASKPSASTTPAAKPSLFGLLGTKGLVTPPPTPAPSVVHTIPGVTPQTAYMATLASQTIISRMTSAFWDAFSGTGAPSVSARLPAPGGALPNWDVDKVRKVLEGKAVVRVVDVDNEKTDITATLEEKMRGLAIENQRSAQAEQSTAPKESRFKGLLR